MKVVYRFYINPNVTIEFLKIALLVYHFKKPYLEKYLYVYVPKRYKRAYLIETVDKNLNAGVVECALEKLASNIFDVEDYDNVPTQFPRREKYNFDNHFRDSPVDILDDRSEEIME